MEYQADLFDIDLLADCFDYFFPVGCAGCVDLCELDPLLFDIFSSHVSVKYDLVEGVALNQMNCFSLHSEILVHPLHLYVIVGTDIC